MNQLHIKTYCHIKNHQIYVDGQLVFEAPEPGSLKEFMKLAFKHFKPGYAKFYKMDEISKLGFIAAEILLKDKPYDHMQPEEVGVVLSNAQSTLVTDMQFQDSIQSDADFYPSPSVFVYTLPNIMIGEICIRHGFRGEQAFYIFENFSANFAANYINHLFLSHKLKACIGGWVNQSPDNYEAFLYRADTETDKQTSITHTGNEVERLYNLIR
ncbi:MAG: 3-oxoacyl-ACP synthase [Bacteroidetes bacterium]|nr:MAG: 3-oxoacyl-ACP synthase [Bacteroidota bacterium]